MRYMNFQSMFSAELNRFFRQWFDTVYPPGGGVHRPQITAPGLDGGGFNCGP
jgi:hypothetical protein